MSLGQVYISKEDHTENYLGCKHTTSTRICYCEMANPYSVSYDCVYLTLLNTFP